ncbi:MAG: HET-C-related protein, partial [Candidatus Cybelea sp.]
HLDNPKGGGTVESDDASSSKMAESESTLSPAQKGALYAYQRHPESVKDAAKLSGLPEYIEHGKQHSRDTLKLAIQQRKTPEGMMNLGNALHGIEDYFSHSNFVEVALAMLAQDGNRAAQNVLDNTRKEAGGFDAATAGKLDPLGRGAGIITGTYGDEAHSANKIVSLIEQLRSEVLTGALQHAFFLGSIREKGNALGSAGKSLLGTLGAGAGALAGAVVGGAAGLGAGLASGFKAGHGFFDTIGSTLSGAFHGMISGGEQEGAAGAELGQEIGGTVGEYEGKIVGGVAGAAEAAAVLAAAQPLFATLQTAVALDLDEKLASNRAQASAVGAPGGAPTHSQVSKDAPEHPAFEESKALAVHADHVIGAAMLAAWANPDVEAGIAEVLPLVDQFVAHPSTNRSMWQPILETILEENAAR